MHEMGVVVYLDGDLRDSLRQIQHPEKRPDLNLDDVQELYRKRRPLFKKSADYVIDIRDKDFVQVAEEAGCLLWEEGLL
jgi:shikimate kinase